MQIESKIVFITGASSGIGAAIAKVLAHLELIQLNNPLGGILRGDEATSALYRKIFDGPARVWVALSDIVEFAPDDMVVFTGRETGEFSLSDQSLVLSIRTSRIVKWFERRRVGGRPVTRLNRRSTSPLRLSAGWGSLLSHWGPTAHLGPVEPALVPWQGHIPAGASAPSAVGAVLESCHAPYRGPCHVPFQGHNPAVAFVPNAADAALVSYPASCRGRSPAPCGGYSLAQMNLGSPEPMLKLRPARKRLPKLHRKIS